MGRFYLIVDKLGSYKILDTGMAINKSFIQEIFGRKIRDLREKRNLTQDTLATKLEISRQTLINYETGKHAMSLPDLYSLADLFEVEVYDLVPSLKDLKKMSSIENAVEKNTTLDKDVKKEIKDFIKEMRKE